MHKCLKKIKIGDKLIFSRWGGFKTNVICEFCPTSRYLTNINKRESIFVRVINNKYFPLQNGKRVPIWTSDTLEKIIKK